MNKDTNTHIHTPSTLIGTSVRNLGNQGLSREKVKIKALVAV